MTICQCKLYSHKKKQPPSQKGLVAVFCKGKGNYTNIEFVDSNIICIENEEFIAKTLILSESQFDLQINKKSLKFDRYNKQLLFYTAQLDTCMYINLLEKVDTITFYNSLDLRFGGGNTNATFIFNVSKNKTIFMEYGGKS